MTGCSSPDGKTPYNHRGQGEGKRETQRKKSKEGTGCPQQLLLTYF